VIKVPEQPAMSGSKKRSRLRRPRPIDLAMQSDRPEKKTMRQLWVDVVRAVNENPVQDVPLYLTLSGAEGRDIQMLLDNGLITQTETGAIDTESSGRVIAVERSPEATLELQKRFPGLKILETDIGTLLHGDRLTRFPSGNDEIYCRAKIVNLDLNQTLRASEDEDQIVFPVITWIRKLCQIHGRPPRINWYLCLTLHGEIGWSPDVCKEMQEFLKENFEGDGDFANSCRNFMGDQFYNEIASENDIDFSHLNTGLQQKILMIFVPKRIAQQINQDSWRVSTQHNIRYGGSAGRAPMVSWILHFHSDRRAASRPSKVYRESLNTILDATIFIDEKGNQLPA